MNDVSTKAERREHQREHQGGTGPPGRRGLERRGLVERQVADCDRRIKTVELTADGVATRERALDAVYAPRAGFLALTATEQAALAKLLRKMTKTQAAYDEQLLDDPEVRAGMRRAAQQRTREHRARGEGRKRGGNWQRPT